MAISWNAFDFRGLTARLQARALGVTSVASFAVMIAGGALVLAASGLHRFETGTGHETRIVLAPPAQGDSPWGAAPRIGGQSAAKPEAPLTSASYTTGFDKSAVGLAPLPRAAVPVKQAAVSDARVCPDNLNCAFRPTRAGAVAVTVAPERPKVTTAATGPAKAAQPAKGFAFLPANLHLPESNLHLPQNLPIASNLLKPFSFVGDKVADFVKKL